MKAQLSRELAAIFRKVTNSHIDEEGNSHCMLTPADCVAINSARMLLARMGAAVAGFDAATAIRACMEEFPERVHDIVEECAQIAENTISTRHAAPPAPVAVPEEVFNRAYERYLKGVLCGDSNKQAALSFLNACRAAMLQAGTLINEGTSFQDNHSVDDTEKVNSPLIPDGYCVMPLKLTAANGAKGALSGEFHIPRTVTCRECGGDGCEDCDDQGEWEEEIPIGWDIIKLIYAAAVEACVLTAAPAAPEQEV